MLARRSRAARSKSFLMNRICRRASFPLIHRICPFWIMFIASLTLNRSCRRLELTKSLLGLDPTSYGSVVLLQNIV